MNLLDWIMEYADSEAIESVIVGPSMDNDNIYKGVNLEPLIGRVLSEDEALPVLHTEFDPVDCVAIAVYTSTWIISVDQYDSMIGKFRLPRAPHDGFIPSMPGGG